MTVLNSGSANNSHCCQGQPQSGSRRRTSENLLRRSMFATTMSCSAHHDNPFPLCSHFSTAWLLAESVHWRWPDVLRIYYTTTSALPSFLPSFFRFHISHFAIRSSHGHWSGRSLQGGRIHSAKSSPGVTRWLLRPGAVWCNHWSMHLRVTNLLPNQRSLGKLDPYKRNRKIVKNDPLTIILKMPSPIGRANFYKKL